jgi:colicin import membrane protein
MMARKSRYRFALSIAIGLHVMIGLFLASDPQSARPVLIEESKNELGENTQAEKDLAKKPEIVNAVAVDVSEVQETVERLKNAKLEALQKEQAKQAALQQEVALAKQARIAEQKRLAAMKVEEEKIAVAHKKAIEEEKKHLKQLAEQKVKEMQALEDLKSKQEEIKKQKAIEKKLEQEKKKALEKQILKKQHELLEAAAEQNKQEALKEAQAAKERAAEQAAIDAAHRAKMAGVVDKYKAMILNAISHQWILPDHVAPGVSSQFRIRLAPNGAVLEVSLLRSSGDVILDRSAQTAIYKASPLPVPADQASFEVFREISLTVRPEQLRG